MKKAILTEYFLKINTVARTALPIAAAIILVMTPGLARAANQTWDGGPTGNSTPWFTDANWVGDAGFPGVQSGTTTTNTDIATIVTSGGNPNIGILLNPANPVLGLGAIEFTGSNRIIGNSSTTAGAAGTLRLNGATVGVANTILYNPGIETLTLQNQNAAGVARTMDIALGNSTDNIVRLVSLGGITISSIIKDGVAGAHLTLGGGVSTGVLTLSGANTYTGGTTVSSSTLLLQGSGTLGSTSAPLTVNGGTLDLNGTTQSVGNLTGTGGTILNNLTASAATLTVGTGDNGGGNYQGVIADNNQKLTTGTVALTKTGTGTITLSGSNTYSAGTIINKGTLLANNTTAGTSATGSGSVTVNSGGTLGGTGYVSGAVTVNSGGTLAPGASIDSFDTGSITLTASGSVLAIDLDVGVVTPAADLLNVTGSVTLGGGTLALSIANIGLLTTPLTFLIVNNNLSDLVVGTFASITGVPAGYTASVTYNYAGNDSLTPARTGDGNDVAVTLSRSSTAVPEASAFLFGLVVCGLIGISSCMRRPTRMPVRIKAA